MSVRACYTCRFYRQNPTGLDVNENGWPKIEIKGKDGKRRQVRWHQELCDHHNRLIQSSLAVGGTIVLVDPHRAKQMVVDGRAFPYGSEADQCESWELPTNKR